MASLFSAATRMALNLVRHAARREAAAIRSIEDIYTGSPAARTAVESRVRQWELYGQGLENLVLGYLGIVATDNGRRRTWIETTEVDVGCPLTWHASGIPAIVAVMSVSAAGSVSLTNTLCATLGPLLTTRIW